MNINPEDMPAPVEYRDVNSDFFDKKPGNWSPEYSPEMVAFYTAQLDAAGKGAGVAGNYGQTVAQALGLTPDNAIPPVPPAQTKEPPMTHTPSNLHNRDLPDYNSARPKVDLDEAELRSRLSSLEEVRTEVTAVAAGISFEDAWHLLQTGDGRDILNREIKRHYIRKEEQRNKERLDRLMEARARFAETDENAAKRRRIEEARKRFEELGLGDGSYEER